MNAPLSQNSPLGKKVIAARSRRRKTSPTAGRHRRNYLFSRRVASVCLVHADHLNTPRLATNAQGQKVWGWEGTAFGDTQPTGTVTINLRFPGQYYDAESGLHYNWNRYYDPKLGRYVTSDPIGLMGGLNTYAYVENNPLRWTDPFGLCKGVWVRTRWKLNETWLPIDNITGGFTCTCYWSCKTCDGSAGEQATTDGDMFYNPNRRSTGRPLNDCDCDKPGQETGCCTTGKNQ